MSGASTSRSTSTGQGGAGRRAARPSSRGSSGGGPGGRSRRRSKASGSSAVVDPTSTADYILETDGGSRGNPGIAGSGSAVYSPVHAELASRWEFITHATNNVAEYTGLIAGLELVASVAAAQGRDADTVAVDVRMDSKLLVEQMSGRWKVKNPDMQGLNARAGELAARFASVTYTWLPRGQNKRADALANRAMDEKSSGSKLLVGLGSPADTAPTDEPAADAPEEQIRPAEPIRAVDEPAAEGDTSADSLPAVPTADADPEQLRAALPQPHPHAASGTRRPRTRLIFLRHGQTPMSAQGLFSGSSDPDLTELGQRQAEAAGRYLAQLGGIAGVVASPKRRTQQTARAVADALGWDPQSDVATVEDLREIDFGSWEGLPYGEVRYGRPQEFREYITNHACAPHGGESLDELSTRVNRAVNSIVTGCSGQTLVVVTHMMPIKAVLRRCFDAGSGFYRGLQLDLASVSVVDFADTPLVRSVNETHHLAELTG